MTRYRGRREHTEVALHRTVIAPWKRVTDIFATHPEIDKVGSTASPAGWIWWNYWWARASYLVQVEKPIKTERRHYYEDWLCRVLVGQPPYPHPEENNGGDMHDIYHFNVSNCWSLSMGGEPIGRGCEPHDAMRLLLQGRFKASG